MALTATGTIAAQNTSTAAFVPRGGPTTIILRGATFGSGTVTLEGSPDGTNWVAQTFPNTTTAITWTAAGSRTIDRFPQGMPLRLSIGAATSPSIPWAVVQDRDL
jgi:hypothetical protein